MNRIGLSWVGLIAVTLIVGGCSKTEGTKTRSSEGPPAQPATVGTGGAGADLKSDSEFVRDVAMMNITEVELSRIALSKATSNDIKLFAQRMIDEHEAAANKLKDALSGQSIQLPAQLDEKHRDAADDLTKKQGLDFDRDYAKAMVEGHQDLAAKLESRLDVQSVAEWKTAAAGRAQGKALPDPNVEMPDVKVRPTPSANDITMKVNQWAADMYPVAHKHLDTARALENTTKKRSTN
jgi:putative membrane protein